MSQVERATVVGRGWKRHVCVGCGSRFSYRVERTVTGTGSTPESAELFAQQECASALKWCVEKHPCPSCGAFQPITFANPRLLLHLCVTVTAFLLLGTPLFLVLCGYQGMFMLLELENYTRTSIAVIASPCIALVALLSVVAHFLIALRNPNRNCESNLLDARKPIHEGKLVLDTEFMAAEAKAYPGFAGFSTTHRLLFGCMILAAVSPLGVEGVRLALGWVANPGWFPAVAGPGDTAYAYFDWTIESIGRQWNGTTNARLKNAQDLGIEDDILASRTRRDEWKDRLYETRQAPRLSEVWIAIDVTDDERLSRQLLELELKAQIRYPDSESATRFANRQRDVSTVRKLQLSTRHSGTIFNILWWLAECIVIILVGGGGGWLCWYNDRLLKRGGRAEFIPES